jgi:hypothetical protein
MAGLVPAIHVFLSLRHARQDVDARHKAGHDEECVTGRVALTNKRRGDAVRRCAAFGPVALAPRLVSPRCLRGLCRLGFGLINLRRIRLGRFSLRSFRGLARFNGFRRCRRRQLAGYLTDTLLK